MPMPVKIQETDFEGVLEIDTGIIRDERGFFGEVFSDATWAAEGFHETFVQDNISQSSKGTLRGMHYQLEPKANGKVIRVLSGSIFDVGVDLRKGSPTFGKWIGKRLTAENALAMYFPPGFAHGFIAEENQTLVYYKSTTIHAPETERSLNYADPAVGIEWPMAPTVLAEKDAQAPFLDKAEYNFGTDS